MNNQVVVFAEKRSAAVAGARVIFSGSSRKCLHKALDNPYGSRKSLRSNFFIELFGFMNPVLPALQAHRQHRGQRHCDAGTGASLVGAAPCLSQVRTARSDIPIRFATSLCVNPCARRVVIC